MLISLSQRARKGTNREEENTVQKQKSYFIEFFFHSETWTNILNLTDIGPIEKKKKKSN